MLFFYYKKVKSGLGFSGRVHIRRAKTRETNNFHLSNTFLTRTLTELINLTHSRIRRAILHHACTKNYL